MNIRVVLKYLGRVLQLEGLVMIPALLLAFGFHEPSAEYAFILSIITCMIIGTLLTLIPQKKMGIYAREGFTAVALAWIILSVFGSLPFYFSGAIASPIDCLFETASGFTTTGASILSEIESLPKSILYWRSFTHWIGGMGVLVFLLAIVPMSVGKGTGETFQLMRAESPGPSVGKLTPNLRATARILYVIYFFLTILEMIFLLLGKMPLFDSVCISFATAGTGGFAITNTSIAAYSSMYLQGVIAVFMMLFGTNFTLYHLLLIRRFKDAFRSEEILTYLGIMGSATILIFFSILDEYTSGARALLDSFFQVSSIMTTTGFSTVNFDLWPELPRFILVMLMIVGACAGSTGGGLKVSRVVILYKSAKQEVNKILHPHAIRTLHVDGKPVSEAMIRSVMNYGVFYCFIIIISSALVSLDNFDMETTVTAVLSCLNNIGPGLSLVGPIGNFSGFSNFAKIVLSFDMLFGRLEIFPMLMLFLPNTWRKVR